jgi:chromosome segregation ATPase
MFMKNMLLSLALIVGLVCGCSLFGNKKSTGPLDETAHIADLERQNKHLQAHIADLERQNKHLQDLLRECQEKGNRLTWAITNAVARQKNAMIRPPNTTGKTPAEIKILIEQENRKIDFLNGEIKALLEEAGLIPYYREKEADK